MKKLNQMKQKLIALGCNEKAIEYEFGGHGFPKCEEDELFYRIRGNQINIKYYYHHPTNFCQDEWIETSYQMEDLI